MHDSYADYWKQRRVSRRSWIRGSSLATAGLVSTIAAGCSSSNNNSSNKSATAPSVTRAGTPALGTAARTATAASAAVKKGGTLIVNTTSDLVPKVTPSEPSVAQTWADTTMFNHLFHYADLNFTPGYELATSHELTPDAMRLTFKLRSGVKWHSGRPFVADDVMWTYQFFATPESHSAYANFAAGVDKMEAPDDHTVVFSFKSPNPAFMDVLAFYTWIADRQSIQSGQAEQGKLNGTGPFKIQEWVPGDHYTLARNPDYWNPVNLDGIRVNIVPSAQTQLINLQTKAAHVVMNLDTKDLKDLSGKPDFRLVPIQATNWWGMSIPAGKGPMQDKRVRQAFNYLIDRKTFVDQALYGFGVAQDLPWPEKSPYYDATLAKLYQYDVNKAKSLLAEAGVQGSSIQLTFTTTPVYPPTIPMAQMFQQGAAQLGIKIDIKNVQYPEFVAGIQKPGALDLTGDTITGAALHPQIFFNGSFWQRIPGNISQYDSDEAEALKAELLKASTPAEIQDGVRKFNQFILDASYFAVVSLDNVPFATLSSVTFPPPHTLSETTPDAIALG
jgi:peptide/nickel transport system substrate-binding protein